MKEKTLLSLALITSLTGLFLLYVISSKLEVSESQIDKITKDNIGEIIKIIGTVEQVSDYSDVLFLTISQPSTIDIVVFKHQNISLSVGNKVEIIGKIEEYNGKLEVIAQRIRRI